MRSTGKLAVPVHFANSEIFKRDESQMSAANATWNRRVSTFGALRSPTTKKVCLFPAPTLCLLRTVNMGECGNVRRRTGRTHQGICQRSKAKDRNNPEVSETSGAAPAPRTSNPTSCGNGRVTHGVFTSSASGQVVGRGGKWRFWTCHWLVWREQRTNFSAQPVHPKCLSSVDR